MVALVVEVAEPGRGRVKIGLDVLHPGLEVAQRLPTRGSTGEGRHDRDGEESGDGPGAGPPSLSPDRHER
jgi:hypothetical protein